jgi:hypothetical protein
MSSVFISYRRDDTAGHAGRLYDRLVQRFGEDRIFMDLQIEPGDDFVERIEQGVGSCEVLLVLVGRQWLTVEDSEGRRRLDDPNDFARLELAAALGRDVRIVPVLVGGARMPEADELPPELARFARRQALDLSDVRFSADFDRLVSTIERELAVAERASGSQLAAAEIPADSPLASGIPAAAAVASRTEAAPRPHDPLPPTHDVQDKEVAQDEEVARPSLDGSGTPQLVASICGVGLVLATFLVPVDQSGTRLAAPGYTAFDVPLIALGAALAASVIFRRSRIGRTLGQLITAALCLLGGVSALALVILAGWLDVLHPGAFFWVLLGLTMLVVGSAGIARLWVSEPVEKLDVPILFATLSGATLAIAAFLPLGKYAEPLLAISDNAVLDGAVAVTLGVAIAWEGLRSRGSFRRRQPHPWLLAPLLQAGVFALLIAQHLSATDESPYLVNFWSLFGVWMIGLVLVCFVRIWNGLSRPGE